MQHKHTYTTQMRGFAAAAARPEYSVKDGSVMSFICQKRGEVCISGGDAKNLNASLNAPLAAQIL